MFLKSFLLGVLVLAVVGCATQTPYRPADDRGRPGYTETKLTPNRYRVTFTGNSSTPSETVTDYALLRAAELTLQEGYEWFGLAHQETDKNTRTSTTVGSDFAVPAQTSVYQRCGLLRCQTSVVHSPGFSTGVGLATSTSSTSYSRVLEIVMGKGSMPNSTEVYDARELVKTLRRWIETNK